MLFEFQSIEPKLFSMQNIIYHTHNYTDLMSEKRGHLQKPVPPLRGRDAHVVAGLHTYRAQGMVAR